MSDWVIYRGYIPASLIPGVRFLSRSTQYYHLNHFTGGLDFEREAGLRRRCRVVVCPAITSGSHRQVLPNNRLI